MDFEAEIFGTQPGTLRNQSGIILNIFVPLYNVPKDTKPSDLEKIQRYVAIHNTNVQRLHLGECTILQLIDSSEIPKDETKKEEETKTDKV